MSTKATPNAHPNARTPETVESLKDLRFSMSRISNGRDQNNIQIYQDPRQINIPDRSLSWSMEYNNI